MAIFFAIFRSQLVEKKETCYLILKQQHSLPNQTRNSNEFGRVKFEENFAFKLENSFNPFTSLPF